MRREMRCLLLIVDIVLCILFSVYGLGNYTVIYKNKVLGEDEKIYLPPGKGAHRVIDAFPFNGEPMAHLRANYLEDVVDLVLIVDAWHTFSGFLKPSLSVDTEARWFHHLDEQGKLLKVIINVFPCDIGKTEIVADTVDPSEHSFAWQRERFQRNIIGEIMMKHWPENETYVLLSMDADELPRKESVKEYVSSYSDLNEGNSLGMMFFYYSFKWIKRDNWDKAIVVNDQFIKKYTATGLNDLRANVSRLTRIRPDQGWHCSYCLSAPKILSKTKSFSHASMFDPNKVNLNWVTRCVNEGIDILNRTAGDVLNLYDGRRGLPTCRKCNHVFHTF